MNRTKWTTVLALISLCGLAFSVGEKFTLQTATEKSLGWAENSCFYPSTGNPFFGFTFSPDGRTLLSKVSVAVPDGKIPDPKGSGKEVDLLVGGFMRLKMKTPDGDWLADKFYALTDFIHSPDQKRWALVAVEKQRRGFKQLQVLLIVDSKIVETLSSDLPKPIHSIAFSSDGNRLAYVIAQPAKGSTNGCVVVDGQPQTPYFGILEGSTSFSSDGRHFAYYALKKAGEAFVVLDGKELDPIKYGSNFDTRIHFSSGGRFMLLCGAAQSVNLFKGISFSVRGAYDLEKQQFLVRPDLAKGFWFSADEKRFAFVRSAIELQGFLITEGNKEMKFTEVQDVIYSPDGQRMAVLDKKGKQLVISIDGTEQKPYSKIEHITFSPDSKRIAYAAKLADGYWALVVDGSESPPCDEIVSPIAKSELLSIIPHRPVFFSPDGHRVAFSAKIDKRYTLIVDDKEVFSSYKLGVPVFSPDSKRVAVWATTDPKEDKKEFIVLDGRELPSYDEVDMWQLNFSPDSRHLTAVARTGKTNLVTVNGIPSSLTYDQLIVSHPSRQSVVFNALDAIQYVGLRKNSLYLVDEKIVRQ